MAAFDDQDRPHVLVSAEGDVAYLTLNRPERLNSFDAEMADAVVDAVESVTDAGVIVITGAGRAFCAGGYLAQLADPDPRQMRRLYYGSLRMFDALRTAPQPVIAAVNGHAAGGGNELVVACDLAIAAESARFGQTGPRIGSAPVLGGTNMLALAIGEKRAKEVSLMCRQYTAQQALEMGWINAVVSDPRLKEETLAWADELLALSPRYLEIAKISSNIWWNACRDNFVSGLGMLSQAIGSEDMTEGANAFMEKRKPDFRGARRSEPG